MKSKIYNPEVFQGNLKNKNYFEGWYFKNVSSDLEHVYSFIPGVSLTKDNPHAFIQVINGISGKTDYISYPLEQFTWDKERLYLKVGNSVFTENSIDLDIDNTNLRITGHLDYSNLVKYPKTLLSPGIMGWYSFIPFMECKHGIVSVNHTISGEIKVNDILYDFGNGKGYIEKDWGTSFPEAWIWMQANNFQDHLVSFNFSVAKIPWIGKFFVGFIAFLYFENKFFLFSTYNNSELSNIVHTRDSLSFSLKNRDSILKVTASKNSFGELIAPVSGDMSRRIKESIDSEIQLELYDIHGNLRYSDASKRAGLEVIEKIFEYLVKNT
jgi:hypothetical protein